MLTVPRFAKAAETEEKARAMSIEFKQRVLQSRGAADQPVGMLVGCSDPAMVEILGHTGYDFAVLDAEHSPMGPAELLPLVRAAKLAGITPFVRMPDRARSTAQKMMDIGMEGLVIPRVERGADVAEVLSATKLPAEGGTRGYCPCCHAIGYSRAGWAGYNEHIGRGQMVIPIIESAAAARNIEEIVAVEGIDAVLFGPGDMAVDMNVEFDSAPIAQAFERVARIAADHDVAVITPSQVPGDIVSKSSALFLGMDLINVSAHFADQLAQARALVRDAAT
jgi:2-keto-3-deoxy-L-rhamnonate aldolase RhmA